VKLIFENEGVELSHQLPEDPILIKGNPGRVQQVVMNLLTNARDATEGCPTRQIHLNLLASGSTATLLIKDTGKGIPEEAQGKIFDSFFTTKSEGKGTGFGLALSSQIAQEHGGRISFDTSPKGTEFKVSLEISNEALKENKKGHENQPRTIKGRVLIADDDDDVREILKDTLEDLGCSVTQCSNGEEALEILKKDQSFLCVFTDSMMPKMTGPKLALAVQDLKIDIPLVLVSGAVSGDPKEEKETQDLFYTSLTKPFEEKQVYEILVKIKENEASLAA